MATANDACATWEISRAAREDGTSPAPGAWYYVFLILFWSFAFRLGTWIGGAP